MTAGSKAIVVGAGIGGLAAAAALSRHMVEVLVIDRDALPDEIGPRLGVGQGSGGMRRGKKPRRVIRVD